MSAALLLTFADPEARRFQRRHHTGESLVREHPQQELGEKRQGPRQEGRHPRPARVRKRSQETQMSLVSRSLDCLRYNCL